MITLIRGHGAKKKFFIDGQEMSEEEFWKAVPPPPESPGLAGQSLVGFKPLHSDTLGVNPKQRDKFREDSIKRGIPTDFDRLGRPIFMSRKHRKDYCQSIGAFDKDAGYGDAAPGSFKGDRPDEPSPEKLYGLPPEAHGHTPERGNLYEALKAVGRRHGLELK